MIWENIIIIDNDLVLLIKALAKGSLDFEKILMYWTASSCASFWPSYFVAIKDNKNENISLSKRPVKGEQSLGAETNTVCS